MKEPDLEEEDLRATITEGRLDVLRRSLSDKPVTVEVTLPSGKKAEVKLADQGDGRQTGSLPVAETGLYRLTDGTHLAFAASGALNPLEIADLRSTPRRCSSWSMPRRRIAWPAEGCRRSAWWAWRQHRRLQLDGADRRRRLHRHRHPPDVPAARAGRSDPGPRRPDVRLAARGQEASACSRSAGARRRTRCPSTGAAGRPAPGAPTSIEARCSIRPRPRRGTSPASIA